MKQTDCLEFSCRAKTGSGKIALEHLPADLASLNARKPLVITDKDVSGRGLVRHIAGAFGASGLTLGVYDGVTASSGMETLRELAGIYNDKGFDAIIAAGTGKVAEFAKVLNIAVSGGANLGRLAGAGRIQNPLGTFVYVATGSGTGRETAGEAALGDLFFSSEYLVPDLVVIDPCMLYAESAASVIDGAMATLSVCLEACAGPGNSPLAGAYAEAAVRLVMDNLIDVARSDFETEKKWRIFQRKCDEKEGLAALANASAMGGYVASNSVSRYAECLGKEVAARCGVSPGICMGLVLPSVLEYFSRKEKMDLSELLLPIAGIEAYCATPGPQRFTSAVFRIRSLVSELFLMTGGSVPRTLADAGIAYGTLSEIAEAAESQIAEMCGNNDSGVDCGSEDRDVCRLILEHAYDGKPLSA